MHHLSFLPSTHYAQEHIYYLSIRPIIPPLSAQAPNSPQDPDQGTFSDVLTQGGNRLVPVFHMHLYDLHVIVLDCSSLLFLSQMQCM